MSEHGGCRAKGLKKQKCKSIREIEGCHVLRYLSGDRQTDSIDRDRDSECLEYT